MKNIVPSTISGFSAQCHFGAVHGAPRAAQEVPRALRGPPRSRQERRGGPREAQEPKSGPGASQEGPGACPGMTPVKRATIGPKRPRKVPPEAPKRLPRSPQREHAGTKTRTGKTTGDTTRGDHRRRRQEKPRQEKTKATEASAR